MTHPHDLPLLIKNDFLSMLCGKVLGQGVSRVVYEHKHDPALVIKVELASGSFQNAIEWETWRALKSTRYSRWLAPCHHISPCGQVLIMSRTRPLGADPKRMPTWLADFKRTNYGMLYGRPVCHDYGTNLLLNHGAFGGSMRTPKWWDAP
jgi:hypothetical protein